MLIAVAGQLSLSLSRSLALSDLSQQIASQPDKYNIFIYHCRFVALKKWLTFKLYKTTQLYCHCVKKFAFWLVIYIKHCIILLKLAFFLTVYVLGSSLSCFLSASDNLHILFVCLFCFVFWLSFCLTVYTCLSSFLHVFVFV